jgi:hypothetical protein
VDDFDFGYEMEKEIIRLKGLSKYDALNLLREYLILQEEYYKLQTQLIYAVQTGGEYLEIEKTLN